MDADGRGWHWQGMGGWGGGDGIGWDGMANANMAVMYSENREMGIQKRAQKPHAIINRGSGPHLRLAPRSEVSGEYPPPPQKVLVYPKDHSCVCIAYPNKCFVCPQHTPRAMVGGIALSIANPPPGFVVGDLIFIEHVHPLHPDTPGVLCLGLWCAPQLLFCVSHGDRLRTNIQLCPPPPPPPSRPKFEPPRSKGAGRGLLSPFWGPGKWPIECMVRAISTCAIMQEGLQLKAPPDDCIARAASTRAAIQ